MFRKRCNHNKNYRQRRWLLGDGTPMVEIECFDCGWKDYGHVYGDSDNWEKLIIIKDGVRIEQNIK